MARKTRHRKARRRYRSRAEGVGYKIPEAGAMVGLSRSGSYAAAAGGFIPTERVSKKLLIVPKLLWDRRVKSIKYGAAKVGAFQG